MNFGNLLFLVYFYVEFLEMTISAIQMAENSPERKKQLEYVHKLISEQVSYRHKEEESARIKAENQQNIYTSYIDNNSYSSEGGKADKLEKKAQRARKELQNSKEEVTNIFTNISYLHTK